MSCGVERFETIGANLQWNARNAWQAKKLFEHSCELCCLRGLRIECERRHIQAAHDYVIETKFRRKKIKKEDEEA